MREKFSDYPETKVDISDENSLKMTLWEIFVCGEERQYCLGYEEKNKLQRRARKLINDILIQVKERK